MPNTPMHMIVVQGSGNRGLELILNYEKSLSTLVDQLKKEGINQESMGVIVNEVCQHIVEEVGAKKIIEGTPELLIQYEHNKN